MPKYKIIVHFDGRGEYIIEANNEQDARENLYDKIAEYSEPNHPDHNANEEIQEIIEIKEDKNN